jgi:DNA-binding NarL/FixJ family response regulator
METNASKRHIAVIEKCMMSAAGLAHFFNMPAFAQYQLHLFSEFDSFKAALSHTPFYSIIYSLSNEREERRNCLVYLGELAIAHNAIQRIVLASDEAEAKLVSHLSPSSLHGIISKTASLTDLRTQFVNLLNETSRGDEGTLGHWHGSQSRLLSPTERAILRYMSSGYSIPEIAAQLERNIKTIRAHKFNAMVKLGVNSDVGLLDAADILKHLTAGDPRRLSLMMPTYS